MTPWQQKVIILTIKKMAKNDSISVGNRVKSARMLSGHSRKSFATASKISMATLRAWEEPSTGRYGLTNKGAKRLIKALNEFGIYCTEEWLLLGQGPGPNIITTSSDRIFDEEEISWGEEEAILKDINAFKKNNPDPVVAIITDGSMLPMFSYGDYVGGSKKHNEDIKHLLGLNCIVQIGEKTLIRRISTVTSNKYTLSSLNQESTVVDPIIAGVELKSAAEIVWHRWRKKIRDVTI